MPHDPQPVLLGRVPIGAILLQAHVPQGYPPEEAKEAFVAAITAEAERQAIDAKVAAAPDLAAEEALWA